MFNSPALDTAIGLVFLFLVYSLLVTSINEGLATVLALRARMLRKGIIENMLSDTSKENRWRNLLKGTSDFFAEIIRFFSGNPNAYTQKTLGTAFYDHPMIKNYGSSRIFPVPSYLPKDNFSAVLVDLLENYFDRYVAEIQKSVPNVTLTKALPVFVKISYLVHFLLEKPENLELLQKDLGVKIDRETLQILQLHLKNSADRIEFFIQRIEDWFDDSMNRITGWYKRQTQIILFMLGLALAISFNVDIVAITGKLSTDKDARDKLVAMAVDAADAYKDDPRVKRIASEMSQTTDTLVQQKKQQQLNDLQAQYEQHREEAKKLLDGDISATNNLMALGWGGYGGAKSDWKKIGYLFANCLEGTRPLGYLLFAFGICLGAPFWFDLLQKLIKIRSAGKKEDTDSNPDNLKLV